MPKRNWNRESVKEVYNIRWYNLRFKLAVEKSVNDGKLSRYLANKLLESYQHLERKRVPNLPNQWWKYLVSDG